MAQVQLMHAGEEALFVLIPLAIVLLIDYRKRRKEKQERFEGGPPVSEEPPAE